MGMVSICRSIDLLMKNPFVAIITILMAAVVSAAACYLYSLETHCKSLPGNPLDGVIHYECEAP